MKDQKSARAAGADSQRTRIVDIAEELGVSTATVSNVIHGKTKKISDETVRRVQELLEARSYIPSMAGILLAQNNSRIIGVVVNDHEKYESRALEDAFIASSLNALSAEIEKAGYFMMVKVTKLWDEIVRFASMWNLEGMVIIGFCEQDYKKLRESMHIPFVVYDGYFQEPGRICNLSIDNFDGGRQLGEYLKALGHQRALCISDNDICVDLERYQGFRAAFGERADFLQIPMAERERRLFYQEKLEWIRQYTAVFVVSDYYAVELMQFLQAQGIRIPEEMAIAGFDDCPICRMVYPPLTTIRQDGARRAQLAVSMLQELKAGNGEGSSITLPVTLVVRQSTGHEIRPDVKYT
ncbi:MAG: LacI family DNA-binding transcriptional regulator [Lachnospiraceae bacterium]|nr:LacI family DNA-binding transcriptional regulator [Lachnospiraceae bacterium]